VASERPTPLASEQWLKKAVLLSFRLNDMSVIPGGPAKPRGGQGRSTSWSAAPQGGLAPSRVCGSPLGSSAPGVVLMPSFVNPAPYVIRAR
jgi:2,3,4,5-tetrahydropyridine-2-carboxylate N-succinyltransferase